MEPSRKRIFIRGIVQGVGFRPTVYKYAGEAGLDGWVRNTAAGVEILAGGDPQRLDAFIGRLKSSPPPLAKIDSFVVEETSEPVSAGFQILESHPAQGDFLPISPDIAICPDCLRELFDPADRRYRYPFINCTNCGPRYTIIQDIPYDRPKTTMAGFKMCPDCEREYSDPGNRRFHAQPVACPRCGPQVWFEAEGRTLARGEDAIRQARECIRQGKIVALKGLGGYLLACDASNEKAVSTLRIRKKRSEKPFALMADSLATIRNYCHVSDLETQVLTSPETPIVLLEKKSGELLPEIIAPTQRTLGFMLPYTPLHHLLLEPEDGYPQVLIMTSGNLSEEPIAYQDEDARARLSSIAEGFLIHDREINIRTDDSVVRVIRDRVYPVRRSRGYAPAPIRLPFSVKPILGVGAELKNTITVARDAYAFPSHYIGDLENMETDASFEESIPHLENLFRVHPAAIACDLHSDYRSTIYATERACAENIPLVQVQHHHAHLAACLAENGRQSNAPVIGVCFDGTGLGPDGAIWGGEFLLGGYAGFERPYHLAYIPLPGGDAAIKKPARSALAHLWNARIPWEDELACVAALTGNERAILENQLQKRINAPLTSSAGRLFDAVSSLVGVCQIATYEGQAAIELENIADPGEESYYSHDFVGEEIHFAQMFVEIIRDLKEGIPAARISAKFHNSLVRMTLAACQRIRAQHGTNTAALSGGVWQNARLLNGTIDALTQNGFEVLRHSQVPPNDGCISLGQIMVASAQIGKG